MHTLLLVSGAPFQWKDLSDMGCCDPLKWLTRGTHASSGIISKNNLCMQAFSYVSLATPFPGGGQEGETNPCQQHISFAAKVVTQRVMVPTLEGCPT